MTCKKAQGFLETVDAPVAEQVEASNVRMGEKEALRLLEGVDRLVAVRGKKIASFDLKKDRPDDATLVAHLLGPTSNLRAPTARVGKTLVVGFNENEFRELLGA